MTIRAGGHHHPPAIQPHVLDHAVTGIYAGGERTANKRRRRLRLPSIFRFGGWMSPGRGTNN